MRTSPHRTARGDLSAGLCQEGMVLGVRDPDLLEDAHFVFAQRGTDERSDLLHLCGSEGPEAQGPAFSRTCATVRTASAWGATALSTVAVP